MFFSDKKIKFNVTGMHCNHCKAAAEKAAMSVVGVKSAVADPKANSLIIKADKNSGDELVSGVIAAVGNCGFKTELA